jgi:hypothetical protein
MIDPLGLNGTEQFAPLPDDSIRELRWKAESMLEYLRENESFLRQFPTGAVDEKCARWQPLAELLAKAMTNHDLTDDARLEAHRVWAEEMHHCALVTIAMCVHARSPNARQRFAAHPEDLQLLVQQLEMKRPAAMQLLTTEDRDQLREQGFLRPGE